MRTSLQFTCPTCNSPEMHPHKPLLLIRAFKVVDANDIAWSHCLVCAGYYDKNLNETNTGNKAKGWFTGGEWLSHAPPAPDGWSHVEGGAVYD